MGIRNEVNYIGIVMAVACSGALCVKGGLGNEQSNDSNKFE